MEEKVGVEEVKPNFSRKVRKPTDYDPRTRAPKH